MQNNNLSEYFNASVTKTKNDYHAGHSDFVILDGNHDFAFQIILKPFPSHSILLNFWLMDYQLAFHLLQNVNHGKDNPMNAPHYSTSGHSPYAGNGVLWV
jgi:hypothetical protein